MKNIKNKIQHSKILSVMLIVCVTVAYLFVTSSFAQEDKTYVTGSFTPSGDQLELNRSHLSFGDVWEMPPDSYSKSYYGQSNDGGTPDIYKGTDVNDDSKVTGHTVYSYYGYVKINDHAGLDSTSVPLTKHDYEDFWSVDYYTEKEIDTVYSGTDKIPVLEAASGKFATYSVIPDSTGTYRIYVYSSANPTGNVQGTFIDNYAALNALGTDFDGSKFTIGTESALQLSFAPITGTSWWYATVQLDEKNLDWTGYSVAVTAMGDAGSTKSDQIVHNNGSAAGITEENCKYGTLLGDGDHYYYNIWTVNDVKFKSMLVLQWDSSVKLGPVTKMDKITIVSDNNATDGYAGALEVTNIFGEVLAVDAGEITAPHAPLYMIPTPDEFSFLDGFNVSDATKVDGTPYFRWIFESTANLCVQWAAPDPLPVITVSGNGYSATSDFYTVPALNATYIGGSASNFVITPDFADIEGATISYTISVPGKDNIEGTITDTLSVPATLDVVTVTVTAKSAAGTERTCVVTFTPTDDPNLPMVAKNTTTQKEYRYIEDALMEAKSGETIVVIADASFKGPDEARRSVWSVDNAGYTIDTGVQFLIPCRDADEGVWGAMPSKTYATTAAPVVYRTVTIPQGIAIFCDGEINVNGHRREDAQGNNGTGVAKGGHGLLVLQGNEDAAQLTINGALYCYGFIKGTGKVEINSGAKAHELMQLYDWPGGSNMAGNPIKGITGWVSSSDKAHTLFFAAHYYIQNIEAPLIVRGGAEMYMEAVVTANSTSVCSSSKLICKSGDTAGLFSLAEGTGVLRTYDPNTDRVTYNTFGSGKIGIGSVTVSAAGQSISSSSYVLGINNALSIIIGDGITVDLTNSYALLPGSELIVEKGGVLNIGGSFYILDKDTWTPGSTGQMTYGTLQSPAYTASRGTTSKMVVNSSGKLVINGTLNVLSSGNVYVTNGTANRSDKIIYGDGMINHLGSLDSSSLKAGYNGDVMKSFEVGLAVGLLCGESKNAADLKTFGNAIYRGLGEKHGHYWYTHRVDYYEGSSTGAAVLIPSLTTYSVGGFPENANTVKYEHDAKLFTGLTSHTDIWSDFADKYEYNDTKKTDQFVQAYYRVCNAKLLVWDKKGGTEGVTLAYRLNDYIWLNATGYIEYDPATFDSSKLTVSDGCEVVEADHVLYIVRKVVAKELPETLTITLSYDGIQSAPFKVDFGTYKTLLESKDTTSAATKALLTAMKTYGDAAKIYFGTGKDAYNSDQNKTPAVLQMDKGQDISLGKSFVGISVGNASLSTKSAKIYFDEALRMSVYFAPSGIDVSKVTQIGLLVSTSSGKELKLDSSPTIYVTYNAIKDVTVNPGGSGNYPTGQPDLGTPITDYSQRPALDANGRWEVCFDLSANAYLQSFELRPYVILEDGSCVYGEQAHYSLAAYISRMYQKSSDKALKNLLAVTWDYAVAADAAF